MKGPDKLNVQPTRRICGTISASLGLAGAGAGWPNT